MHVRLFVLCLNRLKRCGRAHEVLQGVTQIDQAPTRARVMYIASGSGSGHGTDIVISKMAAPLFWPIAICYEPSINGIPALSIRRQKATMRGIKGQIPRAVEMWLAVLRIICQTKRLWLLSGYLWNKLLLAAVT